ncbi:2964_t:CDS:2 [Entrophospora sp. SA101]|nr:10385_t:CDS:2 [Entrophospora sp. SA101]CAJ0831450.1 10064_t:CDS:2 [Entrophospora sp. SA101]CAJ0835555.1 2964_t:CDS:2 [Entrophospora sp. SA101]
MDFSIIFQKIPQALSATINYYRYGPPQPSWNLKLYLIFKIIKGEFGSTNNQTIEDVQKMYMANTTPVNGVLVDELLLPNSLRKESEVYIDDILKDYNHVLVDDWRSVNIGNGLELINYRLSPQNQFPAALHDSITAYNYLIDPPKDADFLPVDPKNIVIMGESAGGGLTMATLLAIRNSTKSLPLPAGAVVWSAWVDLAKTTQSIKDPSLDELDYISDEPFHYATSPAWEEFEQKAKELSEKIQLNIDNKPKFWHKSFDRDGRLQLYASNEGLAIPYVSPLFAESLGGLPPILVQTGDIEKFRDESIYLAHKAANPEKYNLPYYNAEKFKKSPYKTSTKVVLEVYEEMPHVFQIAVNRTTEFIKRLLSGEEEEKGFKALRVTAKGEIIEGLKKEHYETLEWENIGVVPSSTRKVYSIKPDN